MLTDEQRRAYEMRAQKIAFLKIGEEMGISARSASALVREAEQRIREYEMFCRWKEKNAAPVDFPLTRGELELVLFGLQGVKMSMLRGRRPVGPGAAGRGGCPTATAWCRELIRRADAALEPGQAEQEEAFRTRDPAKEFPVFLTAGGGLPAPALAVESQSPCGRGGFPWGRPHEGISVLWETTFSFQRAKPIVVSPFENPFPTRGRGPWTPAEGQRVIVGAFAYHRPPRCTDRQLLAVEILFCHRITF